MSTADFIKNQSLKPSENLNAEGLRFGIAVSEWNDQITGALLSGAIETLLRQGVLEKDITTVQVPGSFELTFAAARFIESRKVDAVIVLGSVVRGETPHFDYVCQGTTQGIAHLNAMSPIPVIFGLLTTDNMQQARDRAGGKLGNKGSECALTAIKMAQLNLGFQKLN